MHYLVRVSRCQHNVPVTTHQSTSQGGWDRVHQGRDLCRHRANQQHRTWDSRESRSCPEQGWLRHTHQNPAGALGSAQSPAASCFHTSKQQPNAMDMNKPQSSSAFPQRVPSLTTKSILRRVLCFVFTPHRNACLK